MIRKPIQGPSLLDLIDDEYAPAEPPRTVTVTPRGTHPIAVTLTAPTREAHIDPFLAHHEKRLRLVGSARLAFDEATWWNNPAASAVGFDCEVYSNFFCICFKRFVDGARLAFEMSSRQRIDDGIRSTVRSVLSANVIVSFNGNGYDLYILAAFLDGADNKALYDLSQAIVARNERPQGRPFAPPLNHVDLMGPLPQGRRSLKEVHGRLHGQFIVDLPFPPNAELTPQQMNVATLYCMNDVDAVEALREALRGPLEMRTEMGKRYGLDLRSLSDAQVGEAVVRAMLPQKPRLRDIEDITFGYNAPEFVHFEGHELKGVLATLTTAMFIADRNGNVTIPEWLRDLTVRIGDMDYQMGIGGLHSQEAHRALRSDDQRFLLDVDVSSQYPNIILGLGLYPEAIGPEYVNIYREIVNERLSAKQRLIEVEKEIAHLEHQLKEMEE